MSAAASTPDPSAPATPAGLVIAEVRFSLPQLMEEIKAERAARTFAMERLDQGEIGKLFKARSARGKNKN